MMGGKPEEWADVIACGGQGGSEEELQAALLTIFTLRNSSSGEQPTASSEIASAKAKICSYYGPIIPRIVRRMMRERPGSDNALLYATYAWLGLLRAIEHYRSPQIKAFTTYAYKCMRGQILRGIFRDRVAGLKETADRAYVLFQHPPLNADRLMKKLPREVADTVIATEIAQAFNAD